jgi:hypothetical protein
MLLYTKHELSPLQPIVIQMNPVMPRLTLPRLLLIIYYSLYSGPIFIGK